MVAGVRVPNWALLTLAALWFLAMFGAAFKVMHGVAVLDARVTGYDLAELRGFLVGLDDGQRDFLLGPMRWMDTGFPPLLALVLWRMAGEWRWGWVLPLVYLVLDWTENAIVASLLRGDPALPNPKLAMLASDLTEAKYAVLGVAVIGLCIRAWRGRAR